MQYLLDTHTILWYLFGNAKLPIKTKEIIDTNECFYSYASFWEISIKQSKNKLDISHTIFEIDEMCNKAGFRKLPITLADFNQIRYLPFQKDVKHNDPFDRILIAQAIKNNMTIITCDENIPLYEVKILWNENKT